MLSGNKTVQDHKPVNDIFVGFNLHIIKACVTSIKLRQQLHFLYLFSTVVLPCYVSSSHIFV